MIAKKKIDPPKSLGAAVKEIAALQETVAKFAADNAATHATVATLQAELAQARSANPVVQPAADQAWRPLKSIDRAHYTYQTILSWAQAGLIEAQKKRGRWFAVPDSVARRLKELL